MKKTLMLSITAIFATILLFGLASAAITTTLSDQSLSQDGGSYTFDVTNDNATEEVNVSISITSGTGIEFTLSTNLLEFTTNDTKTVTIDYDTTDFEFDFGETYEEILTAGDNSADLTFEDSDYCENVEAHGLKITDLTIDTQEGFGDDDDYWYLRDVIEVEVEVESNTYDMDKMEIEWSIYSNGEEVMSGDESIADLDDNDDDVITFEIKLDEDMEDFDNEATLYVKLIGETDDSQAEDDGVDGEDSCYADSQSVEIRNSDDFVIIDDLIINGQRANEGLLDETLSCGNSVTISGTVWNIGDDQDDVRVEIYSSLLNLYKEFEVGDIDAFDSYNFEYTFTLPEELDTIKTYRIQYEVFDDDNDLFENEEEDESLFYNYFKVAGNCVNIAPTVEPKLTTEEVFNGKEMIITTTVRNNEPNSVTYTMLATGFESFADSITISPETIILQAGESVEVEYKFKVSSDSEGEYKFNIETMEAGKVILTQPAAVTVQKKGLSFDFLNDKDFLKIAGIVLLNLIFVVLIIVVARKILRRK